MTDDVIRRTSKGPMNCGASFALNSVDLFW